MEAGQVMEVLTIFAGVLLTGYCLLILVYWIGWLITPYYKTTPEADGSKACFSILIPARNESASILQCLTDIAAQHYDHSCFEVIVIDDHSEDDTAEKVNTFLSGKSIPVRLLRMSDDRAARKLKKASITHGIDHAQHPYIILTDADCERGPEWLSTINSFMQSRKPKMIYAPVVFKANTTFEKIQSLEFSGLVGIGASAIRLKNPNMCSAANLVFEKLAFIEVEGYKDYDGLASGDDEFLMHKIFKRYPDQVHFLKNRNAIVHTSPNASVKQLTDQRRRWVSKSLKYENRYITAILIGAYLFNLALLITLILNPYTGLLLIGIKMLTEGLFLLSLGRFFGIATYLLWLPLAEFFHILYVVVIGIWANAGTYEWKGRKVN